MILNLGTGLHTPPVGTTPVISSTIAGSSMSETVKALWPFFRVAIAPLAAIGFMPSLTIRFRASGAGARQSRWLPRATLRLVEGPAPG